MIKPSEISTLLQQVADKAFITPTALGQYLNSLYNDTVAEMQSSKAKMVEDITKQLAANYNHQINNLKEQHNIASLLYQNQLKELEKLTEEKVKLARQSNNRNEFYWIILIVAIAVGFIIGKLFN